jgi:RNA polymerase sigma-70 factor (ECF subfamily)
VQGDDLETYYLRTYPRVRRYLHRLSRDAAVASDLAQEVFVRLLSSGKESLPLTERDAYVFTIATNLARDRWRRIRRDRELDEVAASEHSSSAVDLHRALEKLSPRDRSLLWLAYVEGLAHRDVARIAGVREKSVKVLLFRVRRRLAALMGRNVDDR